MSVSPNIAAIFCADVVGYSRLGGVDEDRILARLWALRNDRINPAITVHQGRIVNRTGDGEIVERSLKVQRALRAEIECKLSVSFDAADATICRTLAGCGP